MTDAELLNVAESVLADAIADAEFSGLAKDLAYAQFVAERVEKLRAKIQQREPVELTLLLIQHRMHIEYSMPQPGFFRGTS